MSPTPTVPLSVIMPAYNEEGAIAAAVDEVRRDVLDRVAGSELVVVDDGSTDGTGGILDGLAADPRIRVISRKNGGHGAALRAGLDAARGGFFFLVDADRQIPLGGFAAAWAAAQSADGVFGVRARRDDPRIRLWLSQVIRGFVRVTFGAAVPDANVPYKVVRRELWESASRYIPPDTLAPSLFLALYAVRRGYRVEFVEVTHRRRSSGEASINHRRLLAFAFRGMLQLVAFRARLAGG